MSEKDPIRPTPTPPPIPSQPPPLPRVLNYGTPDITPRPFAIWKIFLGLILSVGGAFTVFILPAMASDWISSEYGLLVIGGITLLGINLIAYVTYRTESMRGLMVGFWIGEAVLLLLIGACFAMFL